MAGSSYTEGTRRAYGLSAFTEVRRPPDGRAVLHASPAPTWADGYETVPTPVVGAAVDMLLRYSTFGDDDAFDRALRGAAVLESLGPEGRARAGFEEDVARELAACLEAVTADLSAPNLRLAARLGWVACFDGEDGGYVPPCTYDQAAAMSRGTAGSVAALVERASEMIGSEFGGLATYGIRLSSMADADTYVDYFTADGTLLDLSVSDVPISKADATRLLSYYILGRIETPDFAPVRRLGIVNPRLNRLWYCDVREVNDAFVSVVLDRMAEL